MARYDTTLARKIIGLIDLTDLSDDRGAAGIGPLLEQAGRHGTAAVCVWPEYVAQAVDSLAGSPVRVATVANFPGGDFETSDVLDEVADSLDHGAHEIDLVMPYRAMSAGETGRVADAIAPVADLVHSRDAILKVILETGELVSPTLIEHAGQIAVASGADFLKTSTGKTPVGATLEAVDAMIEAVVKSDRVIGVKPSGGISTVAAASEYIDLVERRLGAGATEPTRLRFGASSLLGAAVAALEH